MTVNLTKGKHQSCGCAPRGKPKGEALSKWPEYRVWQQMVQRCVLTTSPNYAWYGARGIRVCARWTTGEYGKTGFECFIEDMGRRPGRMTLDRVDPDGNYEPNNCRWATWAEQQNNRRDNRIVGAAGFRLTVSQWARQTGLSATAIVDRLQRGWTAEEAVGIAPRPSGPGRRPNRTLRAAAALCALLFAAPAWGHSAHGQWSYEYDCCGGDPAGIRPGGDCAPVPESAVEEATGGYAVRLLPGQHPMAQTPLAGFLAHGSPMLRPSGDGQKHVCTDGRRIICVYVPPGGV